MNTEMIIDTLRPRVSASQPKIQPPSGRMKKPTANTPAVANSCVVVSPLGKNDAAK
ncbi:hypothetical protein D3C80_1830900 [compost metagenome]